MAAAGSVQRRGVPTDKGDAEVVLEGRTRGASGLLVLGHGAGGGIDAVDLVAVRDAALGLGLVVARVVQPYRVQPGKRPPPAAPVLDEAWRACVAVARTWAGPRRPLVVGGRSAGARVACPYRARGWAPPACSRWPSRCTRRVGRTSPAARNWTRPCRRSWSTATGTRSACPTAAGLVRVVVRPGEGHELRRDPAGVAEVVAAWLRELLNLV